MESVIQIKGLQELNARIKEYGPKGHRAARRALIKGAEVLRMAAEVNAPISRREYNTRQFGLQKLHSGHLKRNIVVKISETYQGIKAEIGPRLKVFWGLFVEKGTQPHFTSRGSSIRRKTARYRALREVGRKHPGAKAKPFLKPDFEQNSQLALDVAIAELQASLFNNP